MSKFPGHSHFESLFLEAFWRGRAAQDSANLFCCHLDPVALRRRFQDVTDIEMSHIQPHGAWCKGRKPEQEGQEGPTMAAALRSQVWAADLSSSMVCALLLQNPLEAGTGAGPLLGCWESMTSGDSAPQGLLQGLPQSPTPRTFTHPCVAFPPWHTGSSPLSSAVWDQPRQVSGMPELTDNPGAQTSGLTFRFWAPCVAQTHLRRWGLF